MSSRIRLFIVNRQGSVETRSNFCRWCGAIQGDSITEMSRSLIRLHESFCRGNPRTPKHPADWSRRYNRYMRSPAWKAKRVLFRHWWTSQPPAGPGRAWGCAICGNHPVTLHHATYERFGHEDMEDLYPLCHAHHREFHDDED